MQKNREAEPAEVRLRRFLDSSMDMICTITVAGVFAEVSAACRDVLGYEPEALIGRNYIDFVHPEDRDRTTAQPPPGPDRPAVSFANRYLRKDGATVYLHWSAVWSAADEMFYCAARDLTERVRLEEQLSRAQRLEAVGKLTGGVAHDFNNLLTIILGGAESLVEGLRDNPQLRELAELTQAAGERGAELTSRLLAFARRQPLEPRAIDAAELVAAMEPLVRRTIGEDIDIEIVNRGRSQRCVADPAQLESALLNLCINARDAMPDGGKITIETAQASFDLAYAGAHEEVRPGDYVMIAVIDTGEGMSNDTVEHAFEPFFTTKSAGHGSGLGLSMVYGFIKQSGGHVKIESEPGAGAAVRLYLPRVDLGAAQPAKARTAAMPTGSEHVLVVEDDDLVRGAAEKQLKSLGYRVTVAADGKTAMERLAGAPDVALLFTDVVMPGMNGRQLAEQALLLRPELKVLFTSGYSQDTGHHRGRPDRGVHLLRKPYRKTELAVKVREALKGR